MKLRDRLGLLAIVSVATALRLPGLGTTDLRGDEAFAVIFARQNIAGMFQALRTTESHPPLYYLLLHYFEGLAGQSEFAVRFPSLAFGVLAVPLTFAFTRILLPKSKPGVPFAAAFLVAINPFLIWYAQDTRMYALLLTLSLASMFFFAKLQTTDEKRIWTTYLICTTAVLYTHYSGVLLLLAQNAFVIGSVLGRLLRNPRVTAGMPLLHLRPPSQPYGDGVENGARPSAQPRLGHWLAAQAAVGLLYLPWLLYGALNTLGQAKGELIPTTPLAVFQRALVGYSVGLTAGPLPNIWVFGFLFVFLVGMVYCWRLARPAATLLATYLLVPLAAAAVISLWRPFFTEYYLIYVAPAFIVILASGVQGIIDRVRLPSTGLIVLLFLAAASALSLHNYYDNPAYARGTKWHEVVSYLLANVQAGDLVVQNYPDPAFTYLLRDRLPYALLPMDISNPSDTTSRLERITQDYQRVWLLPYPAQFWDSNGMVEDWLNQHTFRVVASEQGVKLVLYLTSIGKPKQVTPVDAAVGAQLTLSGYAVENLRQDGTAKPGDTVVLTLFWRVVQPVPGNYTVFAHLYASDDHLVAQDDHPPVDASYPTSQWRPGETLTDTYKITLPLSAAPGMYTLAVGMYDPSTGQRLPIQSPSSTLLSDNRLLLARIQMTSK